MYSLAESSRYLRYPSSAGSPFSSIQSSLSPSHCSSLPPDPADILHAKKDKQKAMLAYTTKAFDNCWRTIYFGMLSVLKR
ncbi:hypothetical protein G5I_01110 [Acromyrmex echinatior]|uniref:Uncharacterized protein n=1 Tax=Acromyrmex echinatior TaxID=103372 RepID=F4W6L5_ACREC|nr:hypothetical protein G5I_01110 [Acromyrmex echinatior]